MMTAGAGAVILAALLMAASLIFTDENFLAIAATAIAAHLPVMVIEGIITAICVAFLAKVKPELLPFTNSTPHPTERDAS